MQLIEAFRILQDLLPRSLRELLDENLVKWPARCGSPACVASMTSQNVSISMTAHSAATR